MPGGANSTSLCHSPREKASAQPRNSKELTARLVDFLYDGPLFPMQDRNVSGIYYMIVAIAAFSAMDATGKWLVREVSVFQILAIRSTLATLVLLALTPWIGAETLYRTRQKKFHALRALCAVFAFLFFFTSVRYLPLADAVAVAFGGPFIVTALSVPLLGEKVRARQWAAIALGFVGMLLIVQPTGEGFRPAALLVVAASVSYALVMILTRAMARRSGGTEKTVTFLFYTFAGHAVVGFAGGYGRWERLSPYEWLLACGMGVLALAGHFAMTRAFQLAPVSVVAPFEYTALVWATLLGVIVFSDFPGPDVWIGVAVIVASGLYTVRQEASPA